MHFSPRFDFVPSETWILFKNAGPYIGTDTFFKFPRLYVDFRDPVHFRSEISRALLCARSRARARTCLYATRCERASLHLCSRARAGAAVYTACVSRMTAIS